MLSLLQFTWKVKDIRNGMRLSEECRDTIIFMAGSFIDFARTDLSLLTKKA